MGPAYRSQFRSRALLGSAIVLPGSRLRPPTPSSSGGSNAHSPIAVELLAGMH